MRGRQASKSILIINMVYHSIKQKKSKCLILKLDIEKVFDTVNWDFLLDIMKVMGFGAR